MIRKINISKFGLFSNFQWNFTRSGKKGEVKDVFFEKENIIYGRNYSGKTTLSRIIRSLETKNISDKYENVVFEIELDDRTKIDQNNYKENPLKIRVFNEDFIRENLSFIIDPNGQINSFAILGDNVTIQPQLDKLSNLLGSDEADKETGMYRNLKDLRKIESLKKEEWEKEENNKENLLKDKAKKIKENNNKYGNVNYNITKIKEDIKEINSPTFSLIDTEKEKLNEQIIKEEAKNEIDISLFEQFKLNEFLARAQKLLSKDILDSNKIEELVKNSILNNWVRTGYDLHKKNKDNCKCNFCGNSISENRWQELDRHFDEETEKLRIELVSFQKEISLEINKITNLPDSNIFYSEFQKEAEDVLNSLQEEYSKYKSDIENIKDRIKEREENILQTSIFEIKPSFEIKTFNNLKQIINNLIQRNNQYSQKLSTKQNEAKKELRLLEVKRFLDTIQYDHLLKNISLEESIYMDKEKERKNFEKEIKQKEQQRKELESQLNDESLGAEKVNAYLNNFFGHQNLTLEAIEENTTEKKVKFEIKRDGLTAHHLSEGECSLIAFCYFMAKLYDVETQSHKPIIFMDDPISSLDSNHIFYVYSLINSELSSKDRFEQIFISTHNLEFLKYLKRLQKSNNSKREHFIIHRSKKNTEIILMPEYMKNYVTEFNYLFHQIYKCAKADKIDDTNYHIFYNFGNNIRKFLEVLLFYKYPSNQGEVREANSRRLKQYFDSDVQSTSLTERISNEYSHLEEIFTRSENIIENNIIEMQKLARFVLKKIEEKDEDQYNALLDSIGESQVS